MKMLKMYAGLGLMYMDMFIYLSIWMGPLHHSLKANIFMSVIFGLANIPLIILMALDYKGINAKEFNKLQKENIELKKFRRKMTGFLDLIAERLDIKIVSQDILRGDFPPDAG